MDYAGAEPLYHRAVTGLLKISAAVQRPHPNLEAFIKNYAGCLKKLGRAAADIRETLNELMRPFGFDLGGESGG